MAFKQALPPLLQAMDQRLPNGRTMITPAWAAWFDLIFKIIKRLTSSGIGTGLPTRIVWDGMPYFRTDYGAEGMPMWRGKNGAMVFANGRRNFCGTAQFAGVLTTVTVTFINQEIDTNYRPILQGQLSENYWVTGRLTTGFTINKQTTTAGFCNWYLVQEQVP